MVLDGVDFVFVGVLFVFLYLYVYYVGVVDGDECCWVGGYWFVVVVV